jgi:hypothetical protein
MKPMKVPTDTLHSSATPAAREAQRQPALDALTAALTAVNGTARSHTYTAGQHLRELAMDAEARLAALGIPVSSRAGAELHAKSGDALPNAYAKAGRSVIRTTVVLRRLKAGWVCTEIKRIEDYPTSRPFTRLHLDVVQDEQAVAKLRATYSRTTFPPQPQRGAAD